MKTIRNIGYILWAISGFVILVFIIWALIFLQGYNSCKKEYSINTTINANPL